MQGAAILPNHRAMADPLERTQPVDLLAVTRPVETLTPHPRVLRRGTRPAPAPVLLTDEPLTVDAFEDADEAAEPGAAVEPAPVRPISRPIVRFR